MLHIPIDSWESLTTLGVKKFFLCLHNKKPLDPYVVVSGDAQRGRSRGPDATGPASQDAKNGGPPRRRRRRLIYWGQEVVFFLETRQEYTRCHIRPHDVLFARFDTGSYQNAPDSRDVFRRAIRASEGQTSRIFPSNCESGGATSPRRERWSTSQKPYPFEGSLSIFLCGEKSVFRS